MMPAAPQGAATDNAVLRDVPACESAAPDAFARPITIAILAMGGEGGGVLADWLVDMAEHAGWHAQTTSVPGVAQRTGATIYYLEIFPANLPQARGRLPVLAMMPTSGEIDLAIASELMEAGRAVQRGLVTPDRTTLVASTHRVYSMTEKMAMGDGRVDSARLIAACQAAARLCVLDDFAALAQAAGSVISATLYGAVAATGRLPFGKDDYAQAIRRGGVGVTSSLAAFEAGYARAEWLRSQVATAGAGSNAGSSASASASASADGAVSSPPGRGPALAGLVEEARALLPPVLHATAVHALKRLADYQDVAYGAEYLARLRPFVARHLEGPDDPGGQPGAWLDELMRHLALWMTYEDTIRVADLKTRPARLQRVAREVGLQSGQVMEIDEFLHPRVEEIADVLPAGLGRRVLASGLARGVVARLAGSGRILRTTSLRGYLQLFAVSRLRRWRRASLRHQRETAGIDAWLARVADLLEDDPALALELIRNQRLIKGYSDTHARGSRHFTQLMDALAALRARAGAASAMRELREAALADESGERLATLLVTLTGQSPPPQSSNPQGPRRS